VAPGPTDAGGNVTALPDAPIPQPASTTARASKTPGESLTRAAS
jgi:hypothetical protein